MYLARTLIFPLLLISVPACTVIEKNLLDTGFDASSSTTTGDGAEETGAPTSGTSSGPDITTGTTTGTATDTATDITTDTGTEPSTGTDGMETGTTGLMSEPPGLVTFGTDLLCMPYCVHDDEPRTTVVQPNCQMFVDVIDGDNIPIQECDEVKGEWIIPAGQVRCFAQRIDPAGLTFSEIDDMNEACIDHGSNLEFFVVMSEPLPAGAFLAGVCEPSTKPEFDCPDL